MSQWWTAADSAELDVLVHELSKGAEQHRASCAACKPEPCAFLTSYLEHRETCWKCENSIKLATATYGEPCPRYAEFVAHSDACARCNPCPGMTKAIKIVVEWRDGRALLSRAESLRRALEEAA